MAVTRIKNNQITDSTVNAAAKLVDYSVSSAKLANNLVYSSDLTVTGNLTVQGNTTTIDTTYTVIEDPVILLASNQTGSPSVDIGFIGQRGTSNNVAFVWDESSTEFVTAYTTTGETNTTIAIGSYADLHTANANIGGNLAIGGNVSITGNITGSVTFTGNLSAGNISTAGNVSANYLNATGLSLSGNVVSALNVSGNVAATNVSVTSLGSGQVAIGYTNGLLVGGPDLLWDFANASLFTTGIESNGAINTSDTISATGNITGGNISTVGTFEAASLSASGNVTGGNLVSNGVVTSTGNIVTTANVLGGNVISTALVQGATVSASGNVIGGNVTTGGLISATGTITSSANVIGGNLTTGGQVVATGNVNGGNINGGNVVATANVTGANVIATTLVQGPTVSATGNVIGGNVTTGGVVSATSDITSAANVNGGNLVATTAVVTPTLTGTTVTISATGGAITLSPSGNVSTSSKNINNLADPVQGQDAATKAYVDNMVSTQVAYHQAVAAATTTTLEVATGGTISYNQPNGVGNGVGATLTVTGGTFNLIDTANIQTANTRVLVKNQANAALNGVYIWSNATALTRSIDADVYGPNSSEELSINDYFFVQSGNINAGSAWIVDGPSGTITFGSSSISFAQFSSSQVYTANTQAGIQLTGTVISAKVDYSTTAFDVGGNIIVKASANLVTPNIGAATGTSLSVTGNVTAAGANISGNVSGGNVLTGGLISATGNITGGNLTTAGQVAATGNVNGGNVIATALVQGVTVSASGNVIAGNITTSGSGGNITGANVISGTTLSATANVIGGNLTTAGQVTATGNITGGNVSTAGAVGAATLSASGNVTGGNINTAGQVVATGNVNGGNVVSSALVSGVTVTATGNVNGGNVISTALVQGATLSATGNVTGGNLTTAGQVVATANITGGNVLTGGLISATGNITGGNVIGTTVNGGNIVISGDDITDTNGRVNINTAGADVDFAVNGDTVANILYVDAGTGTVSFGNATQTTNAIVAFNATNSILFPVGNTAQRPSTGVVGMLRFNSISDTLEQYTTTGWESVGTPAFTVIGDEQFNGDGSTTDFVLATVNTTNGVIVSINGVLQIPSSAYSVNTVGATSTLVFTEAPQSGDLIDVRNITTTTTVTGISNQSANAAVDTSPSTSVVTITGDLVPVANLTANLGSASNYWKSLFVGNGTIYLGNIQLKEVGGQMAFYAADGSTPATIAASSVDTTTIANGTSNVSVAASGGNVRFNIGGTSNVAVVYSTGMSITGDLSVTGNATLSGNILGDRVQNGTTSFDIQTTGGNANITVGGTSNVAVFATTGAYVTGLVSASGNIVSSANINASSAFVNAGAVLATGRVEAGTTMSAAGNITGGNVLTGGLISATGNITGGNILGGANVNATTHTGATVSVTGNVVAGAGFYSTSSYSGAYTDGIVVDYVTGNGRISTGAADGLNIYNGGVASTLIASFNTSGALTLGTTGTQTLTTGGIINGNANGVGNIGSSTTYFNTAFVKATSAQYADLAENYVADAKYAPGTVLSFGGEKEVTLSTVASDARIAGVVSTNPSYIMNSVLEAEHVATIALTGRVPTFVTGPITKGDMMVSDGNGRAVACATPTMGTVIGKALENHAGGEGVIEVVVGRL